MRNSLLRLGLITSVLFAVTVVPASASSITIFIPNVLTDNLDSVQFGISGQYVTSDGKTSAEKVNISEIKITKPIDVSSTKLLKEENSVIPSLTLDFFKSSSTTAYEEVQLNDALISGHQINPQGTQDTFSFAYKSITFQYSGSSGNPLGAFLPLSTDVQDGPFSLDLNLLADRLDAQLGDSDISSADTFPGTVPEPASLALLCSGLLGCTALIRFRRNG
jgi:Type VI secretion system effector, Hcp/PEP-CTERM motif